MSTHEAKIQELFRDTLLSDEEIYWIGEPLRNYWHLKGRYLFRFFLVLILISLVILALIVAVLGFSFVQWLISMMTIHTAILSFYIALFVINHIDRYREQQAAKVSSVHEQQKAFYWWKPSYYVITNLRVLIFEQGSIRDYWYPLLDEPILKKPKNRAASIDLYSSSYAAKKKKTPVLDSLRGVAEEEADDVFAILKQAREEALEERKHKMGVG
jgi:hypothetical protein